MCARTNASTSEVTRPPAHASTCCIQGRGARLPAHASTCCMQGRGARPPAHACIIEQGTICGLCVSARQRPGAHRHVAQAASLQVHVHTNTHSCISACPTPTLDLVCACHTCKSQGPLQRQHQWQSIYAHQRRRQLANASRRARKHPMVMPAWTHKQAPTHTRVHVRLLGYAAARSARLSGASSCGAPFACPPRQRARPRPHPRPASPKPSGTCSSL